MAPHEFYDPDKHKTDPDELTAKEVRLELRIARTRLLLAAAFVDLLRYAYRTLQSHGVDYLKLSAYKDTTLLDAASTLPLSEGADSYISWVGRVRNDIKAAVTRKGFTTVGPKRTPPPRNPR